MGSSEKRKSSLLQGRAKAIPDVDMDEETTQAIPRDYGCTKRQLKSRHVQLIALGGTIGTGLFLGSGAALAGAGPASVLMAYVIMATIVFCVVTALGEMTSFLPIPGSSVPYFVDRYVDPSVAFAAGWNYYYAFAILVPTELTAGGLVIGYWIDSVNVGVWITVMLIVIFALNIFTVQIYGEAEFWFAGTKIIAIIGLLLMTLILMCGGNPQHDAFGFRYWNNPGPFVPFLVGGSLGNFLGFWNSFVNAGFAYIFGPEIVCLSAGETISARRNIPKAARRFFYRIVFFYVLGILAIGILVPSNSPQLLNAAGQSTAAASPFVIGIQMAGIPVLNHIINAVILISAWSSANGYVFAASRTLYSLALTGNAPPFFKYCTKRGVPIWCVCSVFLIGCLGYLNVSSSGATVFFWFQNITSISGFCAWMFVFLTYLRYRKAFDLQGFDRRTLPYYSRFQPYASWYGLFMMFIITFFNGFADFFPGRFSASSFLVSYITVFIVLALYIVHKAIFRGPLWKRAEDIDLISGKAEIEELEANDPPRVARNFLERIWFWIA